MYMQTACQQPGIGKVLKYLSADSKMEYDQDPSRNATPTDGDAKRRKKQDSVLSNKKRRTNRTGILDAKGAAEFVDMGRRLDALSVSGGAQKGIVATPSQPVVQPFVIQSFRGNKRLSAKRVAALETKVLKEAMDTKRLPEQQALPKPRLHSRGSFRSEDRDVKHDKRVWGRSLNSSPANRYNPKILTPRQNPELFSKHIQLRGTPDFSKMPSRSTSPKSQRSIDSMGKIHVHLGLGLIETLDLEEHLDDLEKIKQRYSKNEFIDSLSSYRHRGHERCFDNDGCVDMLHGSHALLDPISVRSNMTCDTGRSEEGFASPARNAVYAEWQRQKIPVHIDNLSTADQHALSTISSPNERLLLTRNSKRTNKTVDFDMKPKELAPDDDATPTPVETPSTERTELRSILKRSPLGYQSPDHRNGIDTNHNGTDSFLRTESQRWKIQLPRINSPNKPSSKQKGPFKEKMYHCGDGVSNEFEEIICRYGNCRQASMIRENSLLRDQRQRKGSSKV